MTKLIIIRGNSGSGKSTIAHELRMRMGYGTALVEQDYIRRKLLREQDKAGQPNIGLIRMNAEFALKHGYDVIVEGILPNSRYGDMLRHLIKSFSRAYIYYLDVSFEEALRRHQTRAKSKEFGKEEMRGWFVPNDILGVKHEQVISETSPLEVTIERILKDISR
jgi:adenylylsulfate kinase-like enzyme